jgi:hypothetical protein
MVWNWKPTFSAVSRQSARSSQGMRCILADQPPEECAAPVEPKPPCDAPGLPLDDETDVLVVCDELEREKYVRPDDP